MCGIAAYIGEHKAAPYLLTALKRLQYRGYDSWGLAVSGSGDDPYVVRETGKLEESHFDWLGDRPETIGIAHTRWATHGEVSRRNCHPIEGGIDGTRILTVHNGIIENYAELRKALEEYGFEFKTETDTEVIGHLFDHLVRKALHREPFVDISDVMINLAKLLKGQYSFAMITPSMPRALLLACNGSPLVVSEDGYVASESSAMAGFTDKAYRLESGDLAILYKGDTRLFNADNKYIALSQRMKVTVPTAESDSIGDYPHYMLKEIDEQATLPKLDIPSLGRPSQIVLLGCGSSYNAALAARQYFESLANVQTTVEYASEFRHRNVHQYPEGTLFVAITQSGETKDTLVAIQRVHQERRWAPILVVTNAEHSSAGMCPTKILLNVGPERGVAATKTFTATLLSLLKLASITTEVDELAIQLTLSDAVKKSAQSLAYDVLSDYDHVLYLGRGRNYAIAREGALKLKEVAYIHAEALQSAEMKHGPLALIDDKTLCVFLCPEDGLEQEKVLSNMQEVKARNGRILAITDDVTSKLCASLADWELRLPNTDYRTQPIVFSIALQLLAYNASVALRRDPDRPRSLAKTISVE